MVKAVRKGLKFPGWREDHHQPCSSAVLLRRTGGNATTSTTDRAAGNQEVEALSQLSPRPNIRALLPAHDAEAGFIFSTAARGIFICGESCHTSSLTVSVIFTLKLFSVSTMDGWK